MITVYTKSYSPPPLDRKEILRYMGAREETDGLRDILTECIAEAQSALSYKLCYTELPIEILGDEVDFGFARVNSHGLAKRLENCQSAILFGATVGVGIDRLALKAAVGSQVRELAFSALGTERIEALCDEFCKEQRQLLSAAGYGIKPRFSPGYSDLKIDFQKEFFAALECQKHIGLTLNDSLLMSPKKSVTAIVGVYKL